MCFGDHRCRHFILYSLQIKSIFTNEDITKGPMIGYHRCKHNFRLMNFYVNILICVPTFWCFVFKFPITSPLTPSYYFGLIFV